MPKSSAASTSTGPAALGRTCRSSTECQRRTPQRARRLDVDRLPDPQHLRAHDPGEARDAAEADGDGHVDRAEAERGDEGERQQQAGDGQQDVDDAHQHGVEPAARRNPASSPISAADDQRRRPTAISVACSDRAEPCTTRVNRSRPSLVGAEPVRAPRAAAAAPTVSAAYGSVAVNRPGPNAASDHQDAARAPSTSRPGGQQQAPPVAASTGPTGRAPARPAGPGRRRRPAGAGGCRAIGS